MLKHVSLWGKLYLSWKSTLVWTQNLEYRFFKLTIHPTFGRLIQYYHRLSPIVWVCKVCTLFSSRTLVSTHFGWLRCLVHDACRVCFGFCGSRSRSYVIGTRKARHSCHVAKTDFHWASWGRDCPSQAFTWSGKVRFIAWCLRCPLWSRCACLGYGSAPGSHVKKGLVLHFGTCGILNKYGVCKLEVVILSSLFLFLSLSFPFSLSLSLFLTPTPSTHWWSGEMSLCRKEKHFINYRTDAHGETCIHTMV